jgi:hypothetical protein
MVEDCLFVSCDIVGHSVEPDVRAQVSRAIAVNAIVRATLDAAGPDQALWFSGGDGGHVALVGPSAPAEAWHLLTALRRWSLDSGVLLRIGGCTGPVERLAGADGRTEMIGPGLNLAARLLQRVGSSDRVIVTEEFRSRCASVAGVDAQFHEPRTVRGPFPSEQRVWLVSVRDQFASRWDSSYSPGPAAGQDDRDDLRSALSHKDGLAILYLAKRLLQVNAADGDAIRALRDIMGAEANRIGPSRILARLFSDPSLGQEFVRAAVLVERARGETLFQVGDEGRTMLLILRGRLAGYLPSSDAATGQADFELGPGELVGEMAFALGTKRAATLRCVEDCSLMAFSQSDLFASVSQSPLLTSIRQVVDSIVLGRVLQNTCRTAEYLGGARRTGPLGRHARPWVDLGPHSRTISVGWKERELRFEAPEFREPGLYVLAAGTVELPDGTVLRAQDPEPPILAAEFPGELHHRPARCRLLDDVTLLFIGSAGLDVFGPAVHNRLLTAVRDRVAGEHRPDEWGVGGLAVEGLLRAGGNDQVSRLLDVVFVHGLDGDARTTWHPKDDASLFWPTWLAEDIPGVAVWSLGYEVNASAWRGSSMPLADRATNALATLETQGLGSKPIIFICHSLGGLLVKQMLRHSLDFGVAAWKSIAQQTRGVVFLSTPHSGSDISGWMKHLGSVLRLTVSVDELQAHDPRLRELNTWFRNSPLVSTMGIQAYCEKQTLAGLLVVNESSADPGLQGVVPIPVDANHASICKPESREKLVYSRIRKFVSDRVR